MTSLLTPVQLAELFGEIVETDDVAIDENFFEIGGNSILALDLLEVLQLRSGVELQLIDLVEAATPEGLARALRDRAASARTET